MSADERCLRTTTCLILAWSLQHKLTTAGRGSNVLQMSKVLTIHFVLHLKRNNDTLTTHWH